MLEVCVLVLEVCVCVCVRVCVVCVVCVCVCVCAVCIYGVVGSVFVWAEAKLVFPNPQAVLPYLYIRSTSEN